MSRIVETKVRIGVEATGGEQARATIGSAAEGAKAAQQAFIGLEQAQEAAYANITSMTPEVQGQVQSLTESFSKLRSEMGALPDTLRTVVSGVLSSLQEGNIASASAQTATPAYRRAPENVQAEVARLFEGTYDLTKAGVNVEFGRLGPPPTSTPPATAGADDNSQYNAARWRRLSGSYESRLDTFERRLDGAETDLDTLTPANVREMRQRLGEIGSVGRQARGAAGSDQQDALKGLDERYSGYGSRLDDLLRQRAERGFKDGIEPEQPEYSPNFEKLFERRLTDIGGRVSEVTPRTGDNDLINLERRLTRAAGDLEANRGGLSNDAYGSLRDRLGQQNGNLGDLLRDRYDQNAGRLANPMLERLTGLRGEVDALDPYTAKRSRLASLRGSVNSVQEDLAGFAGRLEPEVFDQLNENLKDLTKKLDENVDAYNESGRGREIGPEGEGGGGGGIGDLITGQLARMGGGGMLGGLLGKIAPGGAAVGGAVAAFSLADRMVSGANREARDTITAQADLARAYGLESDPWELFRNSNSGFTDRDLVALGYRGDDAERVMAQLDRPGAPGAVAEDTKDILRFSRSTGLDEDRVTDAVRTMAQAGTYKPGGAETPLETLKLALTEGVRNGVSQAEVMQSLVNISQQALSEGRRLSPEALAFQASLQKTLADTGNPVMKGQPGADLQKNLNAFVTGQGDPAMQMMLSPAVEGITPAELGLEGPAAEAFTELQKYDPAAASMDALDLLSDGRNPEALARVVKRLQHAMGDNPSMLAHMLEQAGISDEQKYQILGTGLDTLYTDAAGTDKFALGEDLARDPQAANDLARTSSAIPALRDDLDSANSRANLQATGQAEQNLLNLRYGVRQGVNRAKMGAGLSGADDEPAVGTAPGTIPTQEPRPPTRKRTLDPKVYLPFSHDDDETPKLEPERPEPAPPTRRDLGDQVGAASYGVMAGGLEANSGSDSNTRTGAFGWSQVMPENLLGRGHAGHDDILVSGWDQAFARTAEGRPWQRQLMRAGLDAIDPIPDDVALRGAMGDPNALPEWYGGLDKKQQGTIDGFMQSMTEHQLSSYYDLAREDGAGHKEATKRTLAGWYGGPAWLDRDDPDRALSRDNPNFTRGHGAEGREPSIESYIDKALRTGSFGFLEQGKTNASTSSEMRVTVVHQGLGDISVRGLDAKTAEQFRAKLQAATTVLGENLTAVRGPESHHGFG